MAELEPYVFIKGRAYTIKFVEGSFEFNGTLADGTIDNETKEITINVNAKDLDRLIRHELIHGYFDECNLPCYSNDEVLVNWLAYAIPEIQTSIDLIQGMVK